MRRLVGCLTALALLAVAPTAPASVYTLGSDLKAPATIVEAHGADSAFWNTSLEGGGQVAAPQGGQVTVVRVKGSMLDDPRGLITPNPMIHFQTLHPMGDGSVLAELSSQAFYVPVGADPDTVSSYKPINMCLHKGDYLDFNDIGGFQYRWGPWIGMPYQTFARVGGSSTDFYTKDQGTNTGTRWSPADSFQGEELLMQMRFATGPDATDSCPGGYRQHVYPGVSLKRSARLQTSTGLAKFRFTCPQKAYGTCAGTAKAVATLPSGRQVELGSATFKTPHSYTDSLVVPVAGNLVHKIQRAGSVRVVVTAYSHDDPRHDNRVYRQRSLPITDDDKVPVQHKTNRATIVLAADRSL